MALQRQHISALFGKSRRALPQRMQQEQGTGRSPLQVAQRAGPVKSVDTPGATYSARGSYSVPNFNNAFTAQEYLWFSNNFSLAQGAVDQRFDKLSDMSGAYNCHQWALGYSNNAGSPAGQAWDNFDQFFGPYGMERKSSTGTNTVIAVYGNGATSLDHVAVKRTGRWQSKLGPGPLVWHDLDALASPAIYGSVQGYYDLKF
jgi:hypothetical protein